MCCSPNVTYVNKSMRMRCKGQVACVPEAHEGHIKVLVRRSEGKRLVERPGCRWKDNINMGSKGKFLGHRKDITVSG
jgi:hypothetical protein